MDGLACLSARVVYTGHYIMVGFSLDARETGRISHSSSILPSEKNAKLYIKDRSGAGSDFLP